MIVGAGLAGALTAIYLAKRGIGVDVYEARGDVRSEDAGRGRSINLALSNRGIAALRGVGMDSYMLNEAVPMYGRMVHSEDGETRFLPYSGRKGECINSVSRSGLNRALIEQADAFDGVQFVFNEKCVDFDCKIGEATFESGRTRRADAVIACDGAGSAVRQSMEKYVPGFVSESRFLEHGYKELHIPPASGAEKFALDPNALHIWPRHRYMMIALPNADGSFTCTLFLPHTADGKDVPSFDQLNDEAAIEKLFESDFPDAMEKMPTLVEDFVTNPIGQLGTVSCWPWNVGGTSLLLGDSAHAMVPFYGQGMNCAFEDVRALDALLDGPDVDWNSTFSTYADQRKVNTDAISQLAEENFYEMRGAVADPVFVRKRALETKLEQQFPDYFSKYSMVTFREDMPYSLARIKGNKQDEMLMNICAATYDIESIDLNDLMEKIRVIS
jgi:kynurenine 3-monooxygenase